MLLTPSNGLALPLLSTLTGVTGSTSASPNGFDSATAPKGLDSALVVAGGSGGGGGGAPADASPNGFAAEGGTGGGGTVGVPLFRRPITEAVRSAGAGPSPKGWPPLLSLLSCRPHQTGWPLPALRWWHQRLRRRRLLRRCGRWRLVLCGKHMVEVLIDRRLGLSADLHAANAGRPSALAVELEHRLALGADTRRLRHLELGDRHRLRRALRADDPPAMAAVMPAV